MVDGGRASVAVAGIVLAAGTSTRMGRNKLLLELGGSTVLRGAAARALEAGLDPVVVVLGHQADRVRRELDGLPVQIEVNAAYAEGIGTSLRAGLAALRADVSGAVVMLADMPQVTSGMIATLVERYRAGTARLLVSEYDGVTAPPVLYDRSLFPELLAARGDEAGRETVRRHRAGAEVVRWPASAMLDLDLPEDYAGARTRQGD
jgi:molybdenum cofactor cytidylyltransferase